MENFIKVIPIILTTIAIIGGGVVFHKMGEGACIQREVELASLEGKSGQWIDRASAKLEGEIARFCN